MDKSSYRVSIDATSLNQNCVVKMSAEVNGEASHLPRKAAGATLQHSRGGDPSTMTSLPVAAAHEIFATPSSFLRRSRGYSRPMAPAKPVNAVDREQRRGLVSTPSSLSL